MSGRAQPLPPLQGGMLVIATIGISVVTAMTVLDSTIANVALPTIAGNLGVASSQGTWVITFFGVANAIAIPLTGWLARRMGEVRLYFWSTFLFVMASFLCGISSSLGMLIICRILQGAAAGPLIPLSQSLLLACYPREKRGIALSLWSMTIVLAPILGPILGGYICDNYTWNWIFFVNVPVGAVCLVALRIPMAGRETATAKNPIDTVGLILLIIGVGCLQLMLDEGKDKDWFASGYIVILGVLTVVGLVLLVAWELTEEHPVVDLSLFRHRNFTVGTICISLGFLFYFAGVVMMPMMLQTRLGYTSMWAGLSLAPIGIFPVFLSPLIGRFAQRIDMRVIVTMSFLVFSAAYLRTLFSPDVDFAFVWRRSYRIGVAMFFMPLTSIIISGLDAKDIANASSLSNCTRVLAGSIRSSSPPPCGNGGSLHHVRLTESINPFSPAARGLTSSRRWASRRNRPGLGRQRNHAARVPARVQRAGWLRHSFIGLAGLVWLSTPISKKIR
ncbi:MAG: DHA2 family efflux MFS transporter permease subunit [Bilophila wadsworthia]